MHKSLLFTVFVLFLYAPLTHGQCGQNYDKDVRQIIKATEKLPHEKSRIVFAGSSTFRLWDNMAVRSTHSHDVCKSQYASTSLGSLRAHKAKYGCEVNVHWAKP